MLRHDWTSRGAGGGYDHAEIAALIDAFPILRPLRDLPAAVHARLAMLSRMRNYADGTVLLRRGEDAGHAFLLLSGRVCLERVDALGSPALEEIGPGAILGVKPMPESDHQRATARTVGEVEALTLSRLAVALIALQFPDAAASMCLVFLT